MWPSTHKECVLSWGSSIRFSGRLRIELGWLHVVHTFARARQWSGELNHKRSSIWWCGRTARKGLCVWQACVLTWLIVSHFVSRSICRMCWWTVLHPLQNAHQSDTCFSYTKRMWPSAFCQRDTCRMFALECLSVRDCVIARAEHTRIRTIIAK